MDKHALQVLEFGRLLEIIAGHAHSSPGADWVRKRSPQTRLKSITKHHRLYSDLRELVRQGVALPAAHFADPTDCLNRVRPQDAILDGDQLVLCRGFLRAVFELSSFLKDDACRQSERLIDLAERLRLPKDMLLRLDRALDDEGKLFDKASSRLSELRRKVRALENKNRRLLEDLIRNDDMTEVFQEQFVTLRNGRYVVPVRREARGRLAGVVHDLSDSGRTVFMEPEVSVATGNELSATRLEERDECRRILAELSAELRKHLALLQDCLAAAALFDGVCALVRWAVSCRCVLPRFSGRINLRNVRHPLLDWQFRQEGRLNDLVPLSLSLPQGTKAVVVTGSNSGGKTVALKTLGLISMAAQAGLPIPADENSDLEVFDLVFADIGDEQSIVENLSTFTGHLRRMTAILGELSLGRALILLDELGTGTDPLEGGAIGCALLAEFAAMNALTIATTHLGAIKAFAEETEGMINGAVRFNLETLVPEYALEIGKPGASHALRIAERLGLPKSVLRRARERLDSDQLRLENMLVHLEEQQRRAENEEKAARQSLQVTRKEHEALQRQVNELQNKRRNLLHEAYREAEQIVSETRREMEALVAGMKRQDAGNMQTARQRRRAARNVLGEKAGELASERSQTAEKPSDPVPVPDLKKGMTVWVQSLRDNAVIKSVSRGGKKVLVDVKGMEFTVKATDLGRADRAADKGEHSRTAGRISLPRTSPKTGSEINLLGKRVDEACNELDVFLDRALLANMHEVRIVHGFGTGRLMKGVHAYLNESGYRGRFRLADADRKEPGGGGVTILTLGD